MSGFEQAVATPPTTSSESLLAAAPTSVVPQVQALEDGSVVVNGKIYKPEAAAKKIEHADTHIKTLEQENAEKDAATLKLLERIEALESQRNHTDALDKLIAEAKPPEIIPEPPQIQEVSKEELVQATLDTIKGEQVKAQQESNLSACVQEAMGAYGDAYGIRVDEVAAKHSLTNDQVLELAKNQPSVFRSVFLPEGASNKTPDVTRSSVSGIATRITEAPKPKSYLRMSAKERSAEINRRMTALNNPI